MAEEKKVSGKVVMMINRGKRHFQISGGRRVAPGEMVEVAAEEAEKLAVYRDFVDVSKVPVKGSSAAKLSADNAVLLAENAELKKKLAAADKEVVDENAVEKTLVGAGDRKKGR